MRGNGIGPEPPPGPLAREATMNTKTAGNETLATERSETVLRWLAMALALACFLAAAACGGDREAGDAGEFAGTETWVVASEPDWPETPSNAGIASATSDAAANAGTASAPTEAASNAGIPSTPADTSPSAPRAPEEPRVASYEDAEAAFRAGRYGEAVDLFGIYAEERPANPWGHYMLGLAGWKAGHLDIAETHLLRSAELAPDHVATKVNLARVLIEAGRPEEAKRQAAAAEELDPGAVQAKRVHARALSASGEHAAALGKYEDALWIDPDDSWSLNNLGYLLILQGRPDEALGPLALAVRLDSTNVTFLNNFGSALEGAGFAVSALAAYRSAAAIDPGAAAAASAERLGARVAADEPPEVSAAELAHAYREGLVIGSSARGDSAGWWFPGLESPPIRR